MLYRQEATIIKCYICKDVGLAVLNTSINEKFPVYEVLYKCICEKGQKYPSLKSIDSMPFYKDIEKSNKIKFSKQVTFDDAREMLKQRF